MSKSKARYGLFLAVLLLVSFVFFVVYHIIEDSASLISEADCKQLGKLRDMPQVKVLDCNGEIRIEKLEDINTKSPKQL